MRRSTPEEQARAIEIGRKLDAEDGGYPAPDTTDLKARLRAEAVKNGGQSAYAWNARNLCGEAADALDARDRTIERLREALEGLLFTYVVARQADGATSLDIDGEGAVFDAREALKGQTP